MASMALLADLVIVSWIPPKCGANGGLKCHLTPLFAAASARLVCVRVFFKCL
ncbi:hypothetical protein DPMN_103885 [Dreissena polymorpha]|uniref:Uncharacterized protein n=1 Tax=Dreissena polymorpha TaxID=45954 RepID=A0A9D4HAK3_DREPO|nr:hypothetical protein DPMN_103885 [Dreissena polymorpha]